MLDSELNHLKHENGDSGGEEGSISQVIEVSSVRLFLEFKKKELKVH